MSEKHTPGPWRISGYNENMGYPEPVIAGMVSGCTAYVAVCIDCSSMTDANARLIAAAPDLLDALECLKRELILSDVDMDYIESHFRPWINKAESAVAKAHGYLFSPMPDKARGAS